MNVQENNTSIYTAELIAFAQVGVDFASLMEQGGDTKQVVQQLLQLLPRLYSLMLSLPNYFYNPDEDFIEEYISEPAYERVRERWKHLLGTDDLHLSNLSADMQYSDAPVALSLSEQLADIYQHVGNLLGIIRERNDLALPAAIGRCRLYWQEHWGLALISALGALHQLYLQSEDLDAFAEEDHSYDYNTEDLGDEA